MIYDESDDGKDTAMLDGCMDVWIHVSCSVCKCSLFQFLSKNLCVHTGIRCKETCSSST